MQNLEFKILEGQDPEFNILEGQKLEFNILEGQNPEFKILRRSDKHMLCDSFNLQNEKNYAMFSISE